MTFKDLAKWIKSTQILDEQVVLALEEDVETDEMIDGLYACYLPFTAHTNEAEHRMLRGKLWPEKTTSRLYVDLWLDEEIKLADRPYTWHQFLCWINRLDDPNIEATALAAWHLCKLKILENGILYAYVEQADGNI